MENKLVWHSMCVRVNTEPLLCSAVLFNGISLLVFLFISIILCHMNYERLALKVHKDIVNCTLRVWTWHAYPTIFGSRAQKNEYRFRLFLRHVQLRSPVLSIFSWKNVAVSQQALKSQVILAGHWRSVIMYHYCTDKR